MSTPASSTSHSNYHSVGGAPWQGVRVDQHHIPAYEILDRVAPHYAVDLHLSRPYNLEWKNGGRFRNTWMTKGALCISPAHEPLSMRWRDSLEMVSVKLDPSIVLSAADDLKLRGIVEIVESHGDFDAQIAHICHALWAEAEAGYPTGRIFGESLGAAMASCLLQRYSARSKAVVPGGQLPPRVWKQVHDFIEAHLEDDISLQALADIAGLSPFYFARCFKATAGAAPHQFIVARRVEKARQLLLHSSLPISQIAAQCGFSDQSHLNRHMKRMLGITPASIGSRKNEGKNVQ